MAADAKSLNIDLDMVAVGSEDRKVLDLARALLLSQEARVAELEVERKEFQEHEHSCGKCGREAAKTKRRMIFDEMRTQCEACGKWWTTYTKHPHNEPDQSGEGESDA